MQPLKNVFSLSLKMLMLASPQKLLFYGNSAAIFCEEPVALYYNRVLRKTHKNLGV